MKRINLLNSDSGAMVDRRIVVKLLVTYFQRGQSPEILDLMSRMLGLTGTCVTRDTVYVEERGLWANILEAFILLGLRKTRGWHDGYESMRWMQFPLTCCCASCIMTYLQSTT